MNTLTNEMTRLCGEIVSLKESRANLLDNIASANVEMQKDVAGMINGFHKARVEMADDTHKELSDFTNKIKSSVTKLRVKVVGFQTSVHKDLAGAYTVWHGAQHSERPVAEPVGSKHEAASEVEEHGESGQTFDQTAKSRKKKR
jgi:hypothetical protein